jgi:hypothetical protein
MKAYIHTKTFYTSDQSISVHNSSKLEIQMPIRSQIGKKNLIMHTKEYYSAIKGNELLKYGSVMLSRIILKKLKVCILHDSI